jgi:hypothetical protein
MPQFIYTMKGLGRVYPPDSQVLKDIWLSFLPGAKIGVLGLNGSGKSTLLKIMATDRTSAAFPPKASPPTSWRRSRGSMTKTVREIGEGASRSVALARLTNQQKFAKDCRPTRWTGARRTGTGAGPDRHSRHMGARSGSPAMDTAVCHRRKPLSARCLEASGAGSLRSSRQSPIALG